MTTKQKKILETYYDPKQGFSSVKKLYERLKGDGITMKEIKETLENQELYQAFADKKNYYDSYVPFKGIDSQWQMDLGFFKRKPILVMVDALSKKAYGGLLKSKNGKDVAELMDKIFENNKPDELYSDNGKEFDNKHVKDVLSKHGINLVFSDGRHVGMAEVFIRTLKGLLEKMYEPTKSLKQLVDDAFDNYNSSYHSTIKMAPDRVNEKNEEEALENIAKKAKRIPENRKMKKGDFVRIKIEKETFEKGYTEKYSRKIYQVEDVKGTQYLVNGKYYYNNQLKKVNPPEEKVREMMPATKKKVIHKKDVEFVSNNPIIETKRTRKVKVRTD